VRARRFAVVGDPVAHSKSPAMHAAAYRALSLPHRYEAVRATADELPAIVEALRRGAYDGLNVTVPHKERALALADEVQPAARAIGAANTLVRSADGHVVAHNTDAPALAAEIAILVGDTTPAAGVTHGGPAGAELSLAALDALAGRGAPLPVLRGATGLVLGAGGASRAAVAALELLGAAVIVRSRRQPGWAPSREVEARVRAVVQATSAGMTGADPGEAVATVVDWEALPHGAVAIDLVYSPPETPFLRAARARGMRCTNGLGMLVRQGALAFELWLGQPAPLGAMLAAVRGGSTAA